MLPEIIARVPEKLGSSGFSLNGTRSDKNTQFYDNVYRVRRLGVEDSKKLKYIRLQAMDGHLLIW